MPLSAEEQALYDHGQGAVPKWLFASPSAAFEWLLAFVKEFDRVRQYTDEMISQTFIETATGTALELHARDRGTTKRSGESEPALRERLKHPEDAVTEQALMTRVHAIVNAGGVSNIVVAATSTFAISDEDHTSGKTITVPAGTYSINDLATTILNQLISGWTFQVINGYARLNYASTTGALFNVTWTGTTFRNQLGFAADAADWNVVSSGWYQGTSKITGPQAAMVNLRRDRAHMRTDTLGATVECTAFMSRGYRMTSADRPMGYLVILPYGTSASSKQAIEEYLRLFGPAGYVFYTEVRATP